MYPVYERSLRHDLLTCLHQVIGYAELCAEESESTDIKLPITAIAEHARRLVTSVQQGEVSETDIGSLDNALSTIQIADSLAEEVGRMSSAFRKFRSLLEGSQFEPVVDDKTDPDPDEPGGLLLVDDNEQNRDLFCRQLERYQYKVHTAGTASDALERLATRDYDLVLLDVILPDLNGIEVLRRMKADTKTQDIPVIMISALDEYKKVIECIESGAEDFLPKPLDAVLLRARIKASLEKKALRDGQRDEREELKRAYEQLNRMQNQLITQEKLASLGTLTAGIAHEIKNPLNFITNFARVARELVDEIRTEPQTDPETLTDLDQAMSKIEEHGARADRIIRGMLMHSRVGSSERQEIDINNFVTDCVNLAYQGIRASDPSVSISIEKHLDPELGRAEVFPNSLSRVLVNIVQNACQSLRQTRGAAITITTRGTEKCFEICVHDNGPGIPEAIRSRIFEPFFTTRPPGEGTGLGLSISYDIVVREHAGQLSVQSEEKQYTEFTVRLPREAGSPCP